MRGIDVKIGQIVRYETEGGIQMIVQVVNIEPVKGRYGIVLYSDILTVGGAYDIGSEWPIFGHDELELVE